MESALRFLMQVRTLVETLPNVLAISTECEQALNQHNQDMLDIACSNENQDRRIQGVIDSRQLLISRLEDLHTRALRLTK